MLKIGEKVKINGSDWVIRSFSEFESNLTKIVQLNKDLGRDNGVYMCSPVLRSGKVSKTTKSFLRFTKSGNFVSFL